MENFERFKNPFEDGLTYATTFRAYDKRLREWIFETNDMGFNLFGECVQFGEWARVADHYTFERGDHKAADLEVMQWSYLNDKNGKKIYPADIIEFEAFGKGDKQRMICPPIYFWHFWSETEDNKTVEVIGNVFDNPDLITKPL